MIRRAFAVMAATSACVSGPPLPAPSTGAQVEEMLEAGLSALQLGRFDASFVAADAFSWGTGPRDVFTSREELSRSAPGQPFIAHEVERHVYLARDGQSAWFWEMYVRPGHLVRHTGLAARAEGKWMILAQHTSFAHGPEIDKRDEEETLPDLAPVGDAVGRGADEIAGLLRTVVFFDRMMAAATPGDFVLIGTDPGYLAGTVVRAPDRAGENGPRPRDGVRAGLGPGRLTAWAAANVIWLENGKRKMGPMRFLYLFTREDGHWRLVQNHHSYAVD